ncbi:MAG: type I methionyl aminopeptidase [Hyphomicrobiales bacterium]|nr:type I methionyl aminopeptidase [Hyphomicrobiales bacterium]MDE2017233.1 type I methionyl aminopeptidase [Hyphomicrobiales bacterium]
MTQTDALTAAARRPGYIKLHDEAGFAGMRAAGRLVAEALDAVHDMIRPGLPTSAIDAFAFDFARSRGALPATLNYRGYGHSVCTSINHVVCHGMPDDRPLREGDVVNVDLTFVLDGWHGDSSRMYFVGEASRRARRLCEVTHEALMRGIAAIRPGAHLGDVGAAIQDYAEGERCSVVRDFCGHGLGRLFHDEPNVLHYGRVGEGPLLKPGMFFTVEPMINLGKPAVKILPDGWTAVTRDRSLSAQYEHAVGVTREGVEIFTQSPRGLFAPPPG